ncbi:MAG: hypothetical protein BWY19_00682 [bacterium ADurb.Bin212]|nr:MAG: hypothetical protein BWY19_00682 [bacterium ADurb.Bin212]
MNKYETVEKYIASQPSKQSEILQKIRELVKAEMPDAEEAMGYGVASFRLNGKPLLYYAAFKNHIGIYPVPKADGKLADEIKKYQTGKGTMQFILDKPIPYNFIKSLVRARRDENITR